MTIPSSTFRQDILSALQNNVGNRLTAELANGLFVLINSAMTKEIEHLMPPKPAPVVRKDEPIDPA